MNIIDRHAIESALSKDSVIRVVRDAFVAHSEGKILSPAPMHMTYLDAESVRAGDCHVKAAHSAQHAVIAIKIAIGFYDNPSKGLPVSNGLVMLFSRKTGESVALLQDEGLLTTYRTAAAGAIAAGLVETTPQDAIGIVGTGSQAFHQADWSAHYLGLRKVIVFGRSKQKADNLVSKLGENGLSASRADSVSELCSACRIVITTTPASAPVIHESDLPNGSRSRIHFVAMGADTHGKQELDTGILALANVIVVDDQEQCVDHGDVAAAYQKGVVDSSQLESLGAWLSAGKSITDGVSVVDLTGLGAQDLAIASLVMQDS